MKKSTLIWIIVAAVLGMITVWMIARYNAFVTMQENVEGAWGQVQTQYQRRADLVPNAVAVVKAYATHEQQTFFTVAEARAKAISQMKIDPSNITPEELAKYQAAQDEFGKIFDQTVLEVKAVAEDNPTLQSAPVYTKLLDQLEGTENRIAYARSQFNDLTKEYNAAIRRFPGNIIAGMFGFERRVYFEAEAGAEKAPEVEL